MIKIILFVLFVLITIGMGFVFTETEEKKFIGFGFVSLCLAIVSLGIAIVPANTVGVRYSSINGTSENTLQEGFHYVTPFVDKVYLIDTTVQERTCKNIFIQTKDAQFVAMKINIKYKVEKPNAFKVYKNYKTLDNLNTSIIKNYAQNALNEVCSQYNIIEILGEKRNEFQVKTQEVLTKLYQNEGVTLTALTIEDIDAGDEIENAITQEAVAKKEVETAEQQKEKAQIEADTKVIEAQGEADANAIKNKELTKEILTEEFIQKWNGELPVVAGSDGMLIDPNAFIK